MNLKELVQKVKIDDISKKIIELFPKDEEQILGYEYLLGKLKIMEPSENMKNIMIVVYPSIDVFDRSGNSTRSEVCGYDPEKKQTYDIKLCRHAEWLGMQIAEKSLEYYGKEAFLTYVLKDMTFYGFKDSSIKALIDEIEEPVEIDDIEITEDLFDPVSMEQIEQLELESRRIKEILDKNKKSFCNMLGIENTEDISFFTGENAFLI